MLVCLILIAISWQSCQESNVNAIDTTLLEGTWLVVNAKRNAKQTTTLNEAFFVFKGDSTMQTNIIGEELSASYKVNGQVITQGGDKEFNYNILKLTKDTMILGTEIMNYKFEFYLLNERLDPFDKLDEDSLEEKDTIEVIEVDS